MSDFLDRFMLRSSLLAPRCIGLDNNKDPQRIAVKWTSAQQLHKLARVDSGKCDFSAIVLAIFVLNLFSTCAIPALSLLDG